jgi:hypothetical protein
MPGGIDLASVIIMGRQFVADVCGFVGEHNEY